MQQQQRRPISRTAVDRTNPVDAEPSHARRSHRVGMCGRARSMHSTLPPRLGSLHRSHMSQPRRQRSRRLCSRHDQRPKDSQAARSQLDCR